MLGRGMAPALAGMAVGLPAAWGAALVIRSQLFNVEPLDGVTFTAITALVVAVSFIASLLPAWRASRVGPLTALTSE